MSKNCSVCGKKLENRNKTGLCCDHVKNRRTHGMSGTRTYKSWCEMTSRCNNKRNLKYKDYGGRRIKVCLRWTEFAKFLEDMGVRPEGTSIDRMDNDRNYHPLNCRWGTPKEQSNNRRCVEHYKGKNFSDWDKELGFKTGTMRARIKKSKWSWKKATSTLKFERGYKQQPNESKQS